MKNKLNRLNNSSSSTGLSLSKQKLLSKSLLQSSSLFKDDTLTNAYPITINQPEPKEEAKEIAILKKLFFYYSMNERSITFHQYSKLITEAKISTNENEDKSISIIFKTLSKKLNHITFTTFCQTMVEIAELKYYITFIEDKATALNNLLSDYLIPLLVHLQNNHMILASNWKVFLTQLSSKETTNIFIKHSTELRVVYQYYFIDQYNTITDGDLLTTKAEKALIQFCKDNAILPKYSTLSKVKEIFVTITSIYPKSLIHAMRRYPESNEGSIFTYYHFIACLFFLSMKNNYQTRHWKIKRDSINPLMMRELIDDILKRSEYNQILKTDINTPYKTIANDQLIYDSKVSAHCHTRKLSLDVNLNSKTNFKHNKDFKGITTIDELVNKVMSSYSEILIIIFKYFCEVCHDGVYSLLMSKKGLNHFLNNLNFSNKTRESNANSNQTIFSNFDYNTSMTTNMHNNDNSIISSFMMNVMLKKYSNDTSYKKLIHFNLFVRIVLLVAYKLSSNTEDKENSNNKKYTLLETFLSTEPKAFNTNCQYKYKLYQQFIECYLNPLCEQVTHYLQNETKKIQLLQIAYKEDVVTSFVNEMKDLILPILPLYSKENAIRNKGRSELEYAEFAEFLIDFDILPALISKISLMRLFISYTNNVNSLILQNQSSLPGIQYENCFIILILICIGSNSESHSTTIYTKIALFLQKIIKSDGLKKYIANTSNNKIMNELIHLFQQYDGYDYSSQRSFFALIKHNE